jgi:hypothetical protein
MSVLEAILERVLVGDRNAWRELQTSIEPKIVALARRHRSLRTRGLAKLPDDVREVTLASLELLARADFRNLRQFIEHAGELVATEEAGAQAFDHWLRNAVDYVVREHVRQRYGRAPKPSDRDSGLHRLAKRDLQTLADRIDDPEHARALLRSVSMTNHLTVAEILAFIDDEFEPAEARAIRMYFLEGSSPLEIAAALELADEKQASRLIHALTARLRYHFATKNQLVH